MASNYTAFVADKEAHAVVTATQLLATSYGKHNFNILPTEDIDNGAVVKLGSWEGDDYFGISDEAPTFEGEILQQESNGGWLILVTDTEDDTVLIFNPELIYPQFTTDIQEPEEYYNAADEVARGYSLAKYDKFAVTEEGFDGTPEVGATVTADATSHKLVVSTTTA